MFERPKSRSSVRQTDERARARGSMYLLQLVWTQRGNNTSTHTLRVIPATVREPQCFPVACPSTEMIDAGFGSSGEVKSCCSDKAAFLMHLVDTAPGSWQAIGGTPRTRLRLTRRDVPIIASTGQIVLVSRCSGRPRDQYGPIISWRTCAARRWSNFPAAVPGAR